MAQNGYDRSKLYDPGFTTQFRMAENSHSGKMASAVPETMVPETSMPVRADKDAQKSEKTGAEEEKTILGKLYVAGIGPGSLDGMTKEAFKANWRLSGDRRLYGICRSCKAIFSR